MTPGGGGLGNPKQRSPSALSRDRDEGLVSAKGAESYIDL